MSVLSLPEEYRLNKTVDLTKNKKQATLVNLLSFLLLAATVGLGILIRGVNGLFTKIAEDGKNFFTDLALPLIVLIVAYILYIMLHELTHGAFVWLFGKVKPKFGVKLPLYAYCGTDKVFFSKWHYVVIALAPLFIWGIIFSVTARFCFGIWYSVILLLQAGNISGAAGDIFVAILTLKSPKTVLIKDCGVNMEFYLPSEEKDCICDKDGNTDKREDKEDIKND